MKMSSDLCNMIFIEVPLEIHNQGIQKITSEVFDLNEKVSIFCTSDFMGT